MAQSEPTHSDLQLSWLGRHSHTCQPPGHYTPPGPQGTCTQHTANGVLHNTLDILLNTAYTLPCIRTHPDTQPTIYHSPTHTHAHTHTHTHSPHPLTPMQTHTHNVSSHQFPPPMLLPSLPPKLVHTKYNVQRNNQHHNSTESPSG